LGAALRHTLEQEVAAVQPVGDGLARIRARTAHRRRWSRGLVLSAATAGALGLVAGGVYAAVSGDDVTTTTPPVASRPATPTAPSSPTSSPSVAPSTPVPSPSGSGMTKPSTKPGTAVPATAVVPVYYVAPQRDGELRLFREFARVAVPEGRGRAAVTQLFSARAADPDYRSTWPTSTRLLSYSVSGDVATVDVNAAPSEPIAVQQLVYTVTGAESRLSGVQLRVQGKTRGTYRRAPRVDVEGLIWLLQPTEGARVARTFTFGGIASVTEANVSWEVLQNGRVVKEGFTTAAEAGPARADWSDRVTLAPGTYVLRAWAGSGEDGRTIAEDTKTVVVR
jgi:hypothetical protein